MGREGTIWSLLLIAAAALCACERLDRAGSDGGVDGDADGGLPPGDGGAQYCHVGCGGGQPDYDPESEDIGWMCVGTGGGEVRVDGPPGVVLDIPPGALACDIEIVMRRSRVELDDRVQLRIEPHDIALIEPATLRLTYEADDRPRIITAFHASVDHDLVQAGAERVSWQHANVASHDETGGVFDIELDRFGTFYAHWDEGDVAMLHFDVPERYLRPGDVVTSLTRAEGDDFPSWRPGHVALLSCVDDEGRGRVMEASRRTGVCQAPYDDMRREEHMILEPRRPTGWLLGDQERRAVVERAIERWSDEASYAMPGSVDDESESSASLVELALDAAGDGAYEGPSYYWGLTPYEIYRGTRPIERIHVEWNEEILIRVAALAMSGPGPTDADQHVGGYVPAGDISVDGLPEEAIFARDDIVGDGYYYFIWTPRRDQIGQDFEVTFTADGEAFTEDRVPFHIERTVVFEVLGLWNDFFVMPGNALETGFRYAFYGEVPLDVELGTHLLLDHRGQLPPDHPFPDHIFQWLNEGSRLSSDPSMAGIAFRVANTEGTVIDAEDQLWIYTLDHPSGFWMGDEGCGGEARCSPSAVVNSIGDLPDEDPGDGECWTGESTAEGEPECTLRAAIQHANAERGPDVVEFEIPGEAPETITLESELPLIAEAVTIAADTQSDLSPMPITLDGSALEFGDGLAVDAPDCEIRGMEVTGFPMSGIATHTPGELTLRHVDVHHNAAWGVHGEGPVHVLGSEETRSRVESNGTAPESVGGGVLILAPWARAKMRVEHADFVDNGGPGIMTSTGATLADVVVRGNAGPGIRTSVSIDDNLSPSGIYARFGAIEVTGNRGHGIHSDRGTVRLDWGAHLDVRHNGGWGIYADAGSVVLGDAHHGTSERSRIEGNGAGDGCSEWGTDPDGLVDFAEMPCEGGGVYAYTGTEQRSILFDADVVGNDGPGFLSNAGASLSRMRFHQNDAGVVVTGLVGDAARNGDVRVFSGELIVTESRGSGIDLEYGRLITEHPSSLNVSDNGGWGLYLEHGYVRIGDANYGTEERNYVSGNGRGTECFLWSIVDDWRPSRESYPCGGGGIFAFWPGSDDNGWLENTAIEGNAGPGALFGTNDRILLSMTSITDNDGDGLVISAPTTTEISGTALASHMGENVIARNGGDGIRLERGDVYFHVGLTVEDNAGWGLHLYQGNARLLPDFSEERFFLRNGGGDSCMRWSAPESTEQPEHVEEACDGGGIWVEEGWLVASQLTVQDNLGDGIRTAFDVTIEMGLVCGNTGEDIACGGTESLLLVERTCP